jgi:hypothetical protein
MNILYLVFAGLLLIFLIFRGPVMARRVIIFLAPGKRNLSFGSAGTDQSSLIDERRDTVQPVIDKLKEMGFTELGVMAEKPRLGSRTTTEFVMASRERQTFASIWFRREKIAYYLHTPFTGGELVITAFNSFRDFFKDDFITNVVASGDITEMLEAHKEQVTKFVNEGYTPYSEYTQDTFIQATNEYYQSQYPRDQLRTAGFVNLGLLLLPIFFFIIFLWAGIRSG